MARIKIKDLPKDTKISRAEMRKVLGGGLQATPTELSTPQVGTKDGDTFTQLSSDEAQQKALQDTMDRLGKNYSLLTNVIKSKHDEDKAAVNNIR